jgi:hypothetical protein
MAGLVSSLTLSEASGGPNVAIATQPGDAGIVIIRNCEKPKQKAKSLCRCIDFTDFRVK